MSEFGQSGRFVNTNHCSGPDYCTTGYGQKQTFSRYRLTTVRIFPAVLFVSAIDSTITVIIDKVIANFCCFRIAT